MFWKLPPIIKVYEALGAIADGRITVSKNTATVWSSNKNKFYTVTYDPKMNALMCNDNGSYWAGYLGYPAIAFLMQKKIVPLNAVFTKALRGIAWKTINTKFKNDFSKTETLVREQMAKHGVNLTEFDRYADSVLKTIQNLKIQKLGKRVAPPKE